MTRLLVTLAALAAVWSGTPARAGENAMQVCGAKYRAAKTARQLPAGQTWPQFLASCRHGMTAAAPTAAGSTAPATPRTARPPSANQLATRERQHKCGAQWKADKAAGKLAAGETWPHYWSACNARLKGA